MSQVGNKELIQNLRNKLDGGEFQIRIKSLNYEGDVLKILVSYDPDDYDSLQREFLLQASRFAKFGILFSKAKEQLADAERQFKKWKRSKRRIAIERLNRRYKEESIKRGITNDDIDAYIEEKFEEENEGHERRIQRWRTNVDILEVIKDAFKQKKDMLVSAGMLFNKAVDMGFMEINKKKKSFSGD